MKGVILAAGPGEELKPITDEIPKAMVRILDKPILEYSLLRLIDNGIEDIFIVVAPNDNQIRNYFGKGDKWGVEIQYITQEKEFTGIDGAILSLKSKLKGEEQFLLTHCDIIANSSLITRTLNAAENNGADMAVAVALQSEIQDFGVVTLDSKGLVKKVIPEGNVKEGNYVVAGTFLLTGSIFSYLDSGIPFNQCFNKYIEDGGDVAAGIWNEVWIDVGRPWDILRANEFLLNKLEYSRISVKANIEPNVEIKGPVIIESGAEILNGAVIKGPVYIAKDAFIGNNCLIRDHSAIYDNSKIGMGVEIRSSVIMEQASIARLSYVGASIIGKQATLHSGAITINTKTPPSPISTSIQGKEVVVPLTKFGAVIGARCHVGVHSSLLPGTIVPSDSIIAPHQIIGGAVNKNE